MLFLIWADEKYNTPKNPSVVFATQKNPGVFHRPQKLPFGQNVRPKKILQTPLSLKYVSGAPGPTSFFNPFSPMVIVRGIASKKPFTKPSSAMERQGWMYLSITGRALKSLGAVTTSYEDFPLTTMWADVRWRQALTTTDSLQQKFLAAIPFHG